MCALGGRDVGVWSCPALLECLGRLDLPGTCVSVGGVGGELVLV